MGSEWKFVSTVVGISKGIRILAKTGTLGVTTEQELFLLNEKGEVIDHAPIAQVDIKFSGIADSLKMNGNKYIYYFIPQPKKTGMAAGIQHAQELERCEKRNEFKALVASIQGNLQGR